MRRSSLLTLGSLGRTSPSTTSRLKDESAVPSPFLCALKVLPVVWCSLSVTMATDSPGNTPESPPVSPQRAAGFPQDLHERELEKTLEEAEDRDLQADCEETAAEESRGRNLTVAEFEAELAEQGRAGPQVEIAEAAVQQASTELATAITRAGSVLRTAMEELGPPTSRRRS